MDKRHHDHHHQQQQQVTCSIKSESDLAYLTVVHSRVYLSRLVFIGHYRIMSSKYKATAWLSVKRIATGIALIAAHNECTGICLGDINAAADKTVFRVNAAMLYYTTLLVHYIKILTTAATSLAQDRMEQTVSAGSLLISYDYSDQQRYYGTCNNTHSNVLNLIIH
ncbi:hypothetical protein F2P81_002328 [Scophthalmus maximus]|uniref:Uncharacterized protein n=1 Tax=Scophthalmus maximus TaxID=52904 RepID=A0A6A4TLS8_SCOMX|nr:hypothetical protein F2P81_002328 [Scophthalmus maximus]